MNKMYLSDTRLGESVLVLPLPRDGSLPARLLDFGLVRDTKIACVGRSAKGHLGAYELRGAILAIRQEDAKHIPVATWAGDDYG